MIATGTQLPCAGANPQFVRRSLCSISETPSPLLARPFLRLRGEAVDVFSRSRPGNKLRCAGTICCNNPTTFFFQHYDLFYDVPIIMTSTQPR